MGGGGAFAYASNGAGRSTHSFASNGAEGGGGERVGSEIGSHATE